MKQERSYCKTVESHLHSLISAAHTANHLLAMESIASNHSGSEDTFHKDVGAVLLQLSKAVLQHIQQRDKQEEISRQLESTARASDAVTASLTASGESES